MSNALSIAVAWVAVFGVFGIYLVSVLKRTKAVEARVPADRLRWMTTDAPPATDPHEGDSK